jgi:polysaccharide pyruvyl transferase WcaK-like protein
MDWVEKEKNAHSLSQRLADWLDRSPVPLRKFKRWVLRAPVEFRLLREAYHNLDGFDLLIASGGGQLDDYYGGPWSHPYTLLRWAVLAGVHGVPYLFVSIGAGPVNARLSQRFVRGALFLSSYRSYRDHKSLAQVNSIGFRRQDPVYPDLAFSYPVEELPPAGARRSAVIEIGPLNYFGPFGWPEVDQTIYEGYLNRLASFTARLLRQGHTIVFIVGDIVSDRMAVKDLRAILAKDGVFWKEEQIVETNIFTVQELLDEIARTGLVVASRFHGVLLSLLMKRPVLAISYHPKVETLMQDMGQAEHFVSIDTFTPELLWERLQDLQAQSEEVKAHLANCNKEFQKLLNDQFEFLFGKT